MTTNDSLRDILYRLNNVEFLSGDGFEMDCIRNTETGETIDRYEYLFTDIPDTELTMDDGGKIICDGVLLFGDECIEFHDKANEDAYPYHDFTLESYEKVAAILSDIERSNKA